ncbi:MAG: hypothetical protein K2W95_00820 [Candidatus Obscuribacterales bacterium]|nr:hypothetical protein [Candidatus Obscuribacterales bacterium]
MHKRLLNALLVALLVATPAFALPQSKLKNNLKVTGNLTVDGTSTHTGATTQTGNMTVGGTLGVTGVATFTAKPVLSTASISVNGDTVTFQDLGDANVVQTAGTQTIGGTKTFSTAPVITGGLPAAQIQTGSAKRQTQTVRLSPETGAAADATVYRGIIAFRRAGTVTGISYGAAVVPTTGTNVIAVEKNSFSGNTMLNAASVTLNSATIGQSATLTATGADLALTADQVITCEYNAGTQNTDAEQVYVSVEFEPTDF